MIIPSLLSYNKLTTDPGAAGRGSATLFCAPVIKSRIDRSDFEGRGVTQVPSRRLLFWQPWFWFLILVWKSADRCHGGAALLALIYSTGAARQCVIRYKR